MITRQTRKSRKVLLLVLTTLLVLFVALPYCIPVSSPIPMDGQRPFVNSRTENVNGTSFHYRTYFPASTSAKGKILFVHGLGGSTFSWEAAAPQIAKSGYLVVSVDLPGFGYSDRNPTYDHSQAHRSEDVWSLLETIDNALESDLANRPWNLAGHSMGGGTVAAMAIQNESRTQSLILVDGALFNTSRGSFALAFPPLERWAQVILEHALIRRGGIQTFLASAYGKVASPVQIEGYLTPLSLPGTANAASGLIKTAKNEDPMLLASISTPITAIWGSRDTWVPASELDQLKEIRPDVTIRTIEGAAHMPMETHLEEFVHTLLDWLLEKSGGSAS